MGNHALRCRFFLLYWLRYLVDYEDWITVENATSWSDEANNDTFCNVVQLQWGKNLKFRRLGNNIKSEESRDFLCYVSPLILFLPDLSKHATPTPQPYLFVTHSIWNWILSGQILSAQFFRPLGVTKKEVRRKKKVEHENGRNSNDKLYTINWQFSRWQMAKS